MDMVQSLLTMNGLPKNYQPETIKWSIYLNRISNIAIKDKTLEKVWSGLDQQ